MIAKKLLLYTVGFLAVGHSHHPIITYAHGNTIISKSHLTLSLPPAVVVVVAVINQDQDEFPWAAPRL